MAEFKSPKSETDAARKRIKAYKDLLKMVNNEGQKKALKGWIKRDQDVIKLHENARRRS